ncbi:putative aminomethyltransferase, mitochondrial [Neolecta irregularis DAH-3]|uniref:Aminomethyltransferase n=1 Tax=Neolecta irregularis (strain DAH-3) TaxID=1198029 RepID=A0A1U7LN61_NEOID|nr:putative aminomethyltransferase, mitochondrial [Neolecta irregularis DAH-3]|eukprot:OLL24110.1 putative aminomethyltransferase, mitochondrial [Neolecta irregularis DAH-3]
MAEFAGYSMPIQYTQGIPDSHKWVRSKAGLFDVGHMVQMKFRGPKVTAFLESITPSDLNSLAPFSSTLSVLLNTNGGIVDDLIITKHSETEYYVVTNAGCREKDLAYLKSHLENWKGVEWELLDGRGLIALQGPFAADVLNIHTTADLTPLKFGQSAYLTVAGVECHVARGGYTGEDGFEISIKEEKTVQVTESILGSSPDVRLAGLGARDSLRLEAGMCLYGHDLDETTTPVEASLAWVIGKRRRAEGGFPGSSTILQQLREGPARRRVGLVVKEAPARGMAPRNRISPAQKEQQY